MWLLYYGTSLVLVRLRPHSHSNQHVGVSLQMWLRACVFTPDTLSCANRLFKLSIKVCGDCILPCAPHEKKKKEFSPIFSRHRGHRAFLHGVSRTEHVCSVHGPMHSKQKLAKTVSTLHTSRERTDSGVNEAFVLDQACLRVSSHLKMCQSTISPNPPQSLSLRASFSSSRHSPVYGALSMPSLPVSGTAVWASFPCSTWQEERSSSSWDRGRSLSGSRGRPLGRGVLEPEGAEGAVGDEATMLTFTLTTWWTVGDWGWSKRMSSWFTWQPETPLCPIEGPNEGPDDGTDEGPIDGLSDETIGSAGPLCFRRNWHSGWLVEVRMPASTQPFKTWKLCVCVGGGCRLRNKGWGQNQDGLKDDFSKQIMTSDA